ncbi:hypothetical protein G9272_19860 [Streptomyces asoensis]|uniref:Uncharacterized protein n=1 Tax=Streptomyces asoensis TaxID=249586 RepID=A0A6M4WQR8_9ACTN|nr:hypothetical protein [Streptomyces asoensis]QJT02302.1 hypothetical protein G9272_19860 [Streptomyces asoensis]
MTTLGEAGPGAVNGPVSLGGDRLKHLEFLQAVITRLSNHSFLVKGWALTLAAGFFAVSSSQQSWQVAASGLVPLACFWFLDGLFLRQERLFRFLYDDVRRPEVEVENLSMNVGPYLGRISWLEATFSRTLQLFYGALLVADSALVAVNL